MTNRYAVQLKKKSLGFNEFLRDTLNLSITIRLTPQVLIICRIKCLPLANLPGAGHGIIPIQYLRYPLQGNVFVEIPFFLQMTNRYAVQLKKKSLGFNEFFRDTLNLSITARLTSQVLIICRIKCLPPPYLPGTGHGIIPIQYLRYPLQGNVFVGIPFFSTND
jgi:hypothetical protein